MRTQQRKVNEQIGAPPPFPTNSGTTVHPGDNLAPAGRDQVIHRAMELKREMEETSNLAVNALQEKLSALQQEYKNAIAQLAYLGFAEKTPGGMIRNDWPEPDPSAQRAAWPVGMTPGQIAYQKRKAARAAAPVTGTEGKRQLSAEGKKRIAAGQRRRHARARKAKAAAAQII